MRAPPSRPSRVSMSAPTTRPTSPPALYLAPPSLEQLPDLRREDPLCRTSICGEQPDDLAERKDLDDGEPIACGVMQPKTRIANRYPFGPCSDQKRPHRAKPRHRSRAGSPACRRRSEQARRRGSSAGSIPAASMRRGCGNTPGTRPNDAPSGMRRELSKRVNRPASNHLPAPSTTPREPLELQVIDVRRAARREGSCRSAQPPGTWRGGRLANCTKFFRRLPV